MKEDILNICKRMYPKGTLFRCLGSNTIKVSSGNFALSSIAAIPTYCFVYENSSVCYDSGKFAEVVSMDKSQKERLKKLIENI